MIVLWLIIVVGCLFFLFLCWMVWQQDVVFGDLAKTIEDNADRIEKTIEAKKLEVGDKITFRTIEMKISRIYFDDWWTVDAWYIDNSKAYRAIEITGREIVEIERLGKV